MRSWEADGECVVHIRPEFTDTIVAVADLVWLAPKGVHARTSGRTGRRRRADRRSSSPSSRRKYSSAALPMPTAVSIIERVSTVSSMR